MKIASRALPLAIFLAARVNGQAPTATTNPNSAGVVTSYFSVCPTASSTTITLSTTTTICPGPTCSAGGTTTIHYQAQPITTVGPDGKTTIFEEFPYTAPCPCDGGVCDVVYTVTRECPCTAPHPATAVPTGFVTSEMACHVCAQNGGPSTVTVVTPAPNGPYATQTPMMGTPYNGVVAVASAAASAYASAGPNGAVASGGANAAASAGNGYAPAQAYGDSNANANANANAYANNGNAAASADSNANAAAGNPYSPASLTPVYTPVSNGTGVSPPIASYTGSATRVVYAVSAIAAGVVGCMALWL